MTGSDNSDTKRKQRWIPLAIMLLSITGAAAESPVERGRYLVNGILACGNCHTPKDADGRPIPGQELAGGGITLDLFPFAGTAPNITPDRATGIGNWSAQEVKAAITRGERPDHGRLAGQALGLPMWVNFYKALLPADLEAVVAYLRSVPAVHNLIPPPTRSIPVARDVYPDAEAGFTERDLLNPVRRGAYLVAIGHCMECHTPMRLGKTLYEQALGAGGKAFTPAMVRGLPSNWPGVVAPNVTAHPDAGLGRWQDAEIKRAIAEGIGRDGRKLQPPMAFDWYRNLSSTDLDAIVSWLRTLPAKP